MLEAVAGALRALAYDSQPSRNAIVAAGALPRLVALLGSADCGVQEQASGALQNLATGSQHNKDAITAQTLLFLPC